MSQEKYDDSNYARPCCLGWRINNASIEIFSWQYLSLSHQTAHHICCAHTLIRRRKDFALFSMHLAFDAAIRSKSWELNLFGRLFCRCMLLLFFFSSSKSPDKKSWLSIACRALKWLFRLKCIDGFKVSIKLILFFLSAVCLHLFVISCCIENCNQTELVYTSVIAKTSKSNIE